tara:strand:- start:253 stop:639 length:387 start_codon:yes stop_codon:yes gene_type:complete
MAKNMEYWKGKFAQSEANSPFQKNPIKKNKNKKEPKLSKKRIIRAADVELKSGGTMPTEWMVDSSSDRIGVDVYRKGSKKYVRDNSSGEFRQIKKKKIKKIGSYVGPKKVKHLKTIPRGKAWREYLDK